jgi:hypothetical protein
MNKLYIETRKRKSRDECLDEIFGGVKTSPDKIRPNITHWQIDYTKNIVTCLRCNYTHIFEGKSFEEKTAGIIQQIKWLHKCKKLKI